MAAWSTPGRSIGQRGREIVKCLEQNSRHLTEINHAMLEAIDPDRAAWPVCLRPDRRRLYNSSNGHESLALHLFRPGHREIPRSLDAPLRGASTGQVACCRVRTISMFATFPRMPHCSQLRLELASSMSFGYWRIEPDLPGEIENAATRRGASARSESY